MKYRSGKVGTMLSGCNERMGGPNLCLVKGIECNKGLEGRGYVRKGIRA